MARCISFSCLVLLLVCVASVACEEVDSDDIDITFNTGDSMTTEEPPFDGNSDDIDKLRENEEKPDEEANQIDGEDNANSFSYIDGEIPSGEASADDDENLINGQPVDIVNKFNINDFGEDGGEGNMTDAYVTMATNATGGLNGTEAANLTITNSSKPNIRWPCKPYTMSSNETLSPAVVIINNETTLGNVISSMNGTKECGVMLFYSPYCEFCTNLAPLYNAVGRSYSNLIVIASDAQKVMGMSARYGIVGIPTILLFYSGKAVAKYNRTRTVNDFDQFILELTGLHPTIDFNITREDQVGPISSKPKESRDYYLIFSVSFVVLFVVGKLLGTCLKNSLLRVFNRLKTLFKREKVD